MSVSYGTLLAADGIGTACDGVVVQCTRLEIFHHHAMIRCKRFVIRLPREVSFLSDHHHRVAGVDRVPAELRPSGVIVVGIGDNDIRRLIGSRSSCGDRYQTTYECSKKKCVAHRTFSAHPLGSNSPSRNAVLAFRRQRARHGPAVLKLLASLAARRYQRKSCRCRGRFEGPNSAGGNL